MALAKGTDTASPDRQATELVVAIVGGGVQATSLLRTIADTGEIVVAAVCSRRSRTTTTRIAEGLGIYTTRDLTEVFQVPGLDLVIDVSSDSETRAQLRSQCPPGVEILGAIGSDLVGDLLVAKKRSQERERLFVELQVAYDRIRGHEQSLVASRSALQRANGELEGRLAEISFTHEFFKALASYITIEDVCSLIVDGCNGILGVEISCVYLFCRESWTLELRACQGCPDTAFRKAVPVSETILGRAFQQGAIQEVDADCSSPSTAWLSGECAISSQAAVDLRIGDEVIGVLVMASTEQREFSAAEMERLMVLSNQSSLSLQNALLHAELERLSVTDRLTDLYNHGHFKERLDEELKRAARFGHEMSLIMFDLDDFKAFNDTFGHPQGDALLKEVSEVVQANLRTMDIAARYGGEEFVVVLPETDTAGAMAVGERIREGVEAIQVDGPISAPVLKTISVGVATFPQHAASSLRLLESADAAMYRAKRAGKNQVVCAGQ